MDRLYHIRAELDTISIRLMANNDRLHHSNQSTNTNHIFIIVVGLIFWFVYCEIFHAKVLISVTMQTIRSPEDNVNNVRTQVSDFMENYEICKTLSTLPHKFWAAAELVVQFSIELSSILIPLNYGDYTRAFAIIKTPHYWIDSFEI